MRGMDLLQQMNLVDAEFVEEADSFVQTKRRGWVRWGALAACVCFVAVGVYELWSLYGAKPFGMGDILDHTVHGEEWRGEKVPGLGEGGSYEEQIAYGFTLAGNDSIVYYPISFAQCVRYDLVEEGAVGLTPDNTPPILPEDLGPWMGTVGACEDTSLVGCQVYHYAPYAHYDSICVVQTSNGYAFYTADGIQTQEETSQTSDGMLEAYGLPGSLERMEILNPDAQPLGAITDKAAISDVFEILSGKEDRGTQATEQRFAQLWYEVYQNELVYYDPVSGTCAYQEEPLSHTPQPGQMEPEPSLAPNNLYDTAQALWTQGERLIRITTHQGFLCQLNYFPTIRTLIWGDGHYQLDEIEAARLQALLQTYEVTHNR